MAATHCQLSQVQPSPGPSVVSPGRYSMAQRDSLSRDCEPCSSTSRASGNAQSRRQQGTSSWSDGRLGPQSRADIFNWPQAAVLVLQANGKLLTQMDLQKELIDKCSEGLCLITEYSGLGGPEESLSQLMECVSSLAGKTFDNVSCLKAGDIQEHCRKVLCSHSGPLAPKCVFGDLLDRCPAAKRRKLSAMSAAAQNRVSGAVARGQPKNKVIETIGRKLFSRAARFMLGDTSDPDVQNARAWCDQHEQYCVAVPPRTASFAGSRGMIGGTCCYDWSIRGKMAGWTGDSFAVYMAFIRELNYGDFDWAVLECTSTFDHATGLQPLASKYTIRVLSISPVLFGTPCTRMRKYMLLLRTTSMRWLPEIEQHGHQTAFEMLFCSKLPFAW